MAAGRGLLFLLVLALWTWKLLEPIPVPARITHELSDVARFLLAKGLHLSAYAVLTVWAIRLPLSAYGRCFLVGLLALHGVATEIGQTFVPGRTGSAVDILIDWLGIGLGVVVSCGMPRPTRPSTPGHTQPPSLS
jgi:VanZ family protein